MSDLCFYFEGKKKSNNILIIVDGPCNLPCNAFYPLLGGMNKKKLLKIGDRLEDSIFKFKELKGKRELGWVVRGEIEFYICRFGSWTERKREKFLSNIFGKICRPDCHYLKSTTINNIGS